MFNFRKPKRVFLDYASATPIRPEVRAVVNEYEETQFANPSALYLEARNARERLTYARKQVAHVLNTSHDNIIFTSGGTEGNNMAIHGVIRAAQAKGIIPHVISVRTEHTSVRELLLQYDEASVHVTLLEPNTDGLISAEHVRAALTPETVLVSVMYVNNEIGVVQPIREIAHMVREWRNAHTTSYPYIHTDACQAPLWYRLDTSILGVDLITLDGLKIGGPAGIGALYVRPGTLITPIMYGGGQEKGLRSGTEVVGRALGLGCAVSLANTERERVSTQVEELRDLLFSGIREIFPNVIINGSMKHRAPNTLNVCFPGYDAEYMVVALDTYGVAVSYSSSCLHLKEDSSSYVIEALNPKCKNASIRFTLGRETTKNDISFVLGALKRALVQVQLTC